MKHIFVFSKKKKTIKKDRTVLFVKMFFCFFLFTLFPEINKHNYNKIDLEIR